MTYICNDCHNSFGEDDIVIESYSQSHYYGEGYAEEEMCEWHCPHCDSENIEEGYYDEEDYT